VFVALLLPLALAAAAHAAPAAEAWDAYANPRFEYAFQYPPRLVQLEREADNGDGRRWRARTGPAHGDIFGAYVEDAAGFRERAADAERDCPGRRASYRVDRPGLLARSCVTAGGEVVYMKAVRKRDRVIQFDAHYPVAERARWDAVVAGMADRLAVGEGER
jgi:hypothetical protein